MDQVKTGLTAETMNIHVCACTFGPCSFTVIRTRQEQTLTHARTSNRTITGHHGGILFSRKCLFNKQLKESQAASLQEECLHSRAVGKTERERKIHRGGEEGEIEGVKGGRKKAGELNEVESRIWHFHRCAQQGV